MRRLLAILPVLAADLVIATPAAAFNTNAVWWQEDQIPLQLELVLPGSEDLGQQVTEEVVLATMDAWTELPCTTVVYEFLGWVDEVVPMDGVIQIEWIENGWVGYEHIAAATAIQIDPFEERVVDVNMSFNGQYIEWATDNSNPYANPMRLDVRAVLLHELGHVFGLDHNNDFIESTMFFAYMSSAGGYLSWDDKWGLCSLYPGVGDECQVDEDCPEHPLQDYVCRTIPDLGRKVCEEVYDDLGACCDVHWSNCADAACKVDMFSHEGYCTWFCEDNGGCPGDWSCEPVTFLGEERSWCVSPLGSGQPCGDEFEWPGDDDDSAGDDDTGSDDDDTGSDDDASDNDDDDGGCGCQGDPARGTWPAALTLLVLAVARGAQRRRR